ncbi:MAG: serine/threonine protein kinase [Verrucomicrobia bacterium]|nr:serine/threonine protein kinase [Verrucomicrobiota bacterium]
MSAPRTCEECGAELPANAPQGLCPRCLANMGLGLLPATAPLVADIHVERTGTIIGRYKLLEKIGEGGFGVVFMADQVEPVQRKVALKIIKAGMDTKEVIARFEAERQAIALMDHPNIARALDAGATEAGRPYFVMELVRGIPITDYCDRENLSTRERLELFMKVCQAVQHAHQKGVIHRDLKPSNVLVTEHDGEPVPKVIDFGVAKALGQKLTEKTLFTGFQHMIGTPAYMSPEQAALSGLDIDTRADIYSLGVLLYELLTGVTPFDVETFRKAALDEVRRMIRETEPPKPSTRLAQELVAADVRRLHSKSEIRDPKSAEEVRASSRRLLQIKETIRLVRGDLDWIVMKCLEKDRQRRYETANGLAADVARHLKNEPVVARPPSRLYEFQKTVRRHKFGFAAAGALISVLAVGVLVSTWQAVRAGRAEQDQGRLRLQAEAEQKKAQTEAAKSQQVAQFLKDMLKGVSPWVASGRDTTVLREILDKAAGRLSGDLSNQPEVELELRNTIGQVYRDLGDDKNAEGVLRDVPAIARKLWGNDDLRLADSLQNLALAFAGPNGKPKEAEALQLEVLAIRRKALGNESPAVGQSLRDLANVLRIQGRRIEAEKTEREALAIQSKLWPQGNSEVAASLLDLEIVLREDGRWPEAEIAARQALDMYLKLSGKENPDVARSLGELGYVLQGQDKLAEAGPLLRKALAMHTKLYGKENPGVANSLGNLVDVLMREGKFDDIEPLFNDLLTPTFQTQPKSAGLLRERGAWRARTRHWQEAAADFSRSVEFEPENHEAYHALAPLLVQSGDLQGYRQLCAQELARFRSTSDPRIAERTAKDCLILPDSGVDLSTVNAWADIAVTAGKDRVYAPWFQFCKGLAEYRQGHFAGAVDWMQKVLSHAGDNLDRDGGAYLVLAMAQYRSKQADQAGATLAKGVEIAARRLPRLDSGDLGGDWDDWIITHALMREAKALIQRPPATPKE